MSETPDELTRRVLREHGLPEGLLPSGMSLAEIAPDGSFRVAYGSEVKRRVGGYRVRYGTVITGRLSAGRVGELEGVDAHKLLWIRVRQITSGPQGLAFSVGPVEVKLPGTAFDDRTS